MPDEFRCAYKRTSSIRREKLENAQQIRRLAQGEIGFASENLRKRWTDKHLAEVYRNGGETSRTQAAHYFFKIEHHKNPGILGFSVSSVRFSRLCRFVSAFRFRVGPLAANRRENFTRRSISSARRRFASPPSIFSARLRCASPSTTHSDARPRLCRTDECPAPATPRLSRPLDAARL